MLELYRVLQYPLGTSRGLALVNGNAQVDQAAEVLVVGRDGLGQLVRARHAPGVGSRDVQGRACEDVTQDVFFFFTPWFLRGPSDLNIN